MTLKIPIPVLNILISIKDCYQSFRKHAKAGSKGSNVLPLDEVVLAERSVSDIAKVFRGWTLIGPVEMLLAQGKAMIHTSCRSESSNYKLVLV